MDQEIYFLSQYLDCIQRSSHALREGRHFSEWVNCLGDPINCNLLSVAGGQLKIKIRELALGFRFIEEEWNLLFALGS